MGGSRVKGQILWKKTKLCYDSKGCIVYDWNILIDNHKSIPSQVEFPQTKQSLARGFWPSADWLTLSFPLLLITHRPHGAIHRTEISGRFVKKMLAHFHEQRKHAMTVAADAGVHSALHCPVSASGGDSCEDQSAVTEQRVTPVTRPHNKHHNLVSWHPWPGDIVLIREEKNISCDEKWWFMFCDCDVSHSSAL